MRKELNTELAHLKAWKLLPKVNVLKEIIVLNSSPSLLS